VAASKKRILHLALHRRCFAEIVAGYLFRNGYNRHAPEMLVEFKGVRRLGKGRGAEYAIRLGRILQLKRWGRDRKRH
jgi:hypothetical protein